MSKKSNSNWWANFAKIFVLVVVTVGTFGVWYFAYTTFREQLGFMMFMGVAVLGVTYFLILSSFPSSDSEDVVKTKCPKCGCKFLAEEFDDDEEDDDDEAQEGR